MQKDAAKRRLCMRFERGDQYYWLDGKGILNVQSTVTNADLSGKPPHRVRNVYNHIRPLIEDKVSAATARPPTYMVDAATNDPEDKSAAALSEKVALHVFEQAGLHKVRMKNVKSAIAHGGEGFAFPYFEQNVGPYTHVPEGGPDGNGEWVGQGEIRVKTFGGNEVYWEAGVDFEHSRWWATEQARTVDEVKQTPGYIGGDLSPDASTSDLATDAQKVADGNLVMVTDYFERPCPQWPEGRRIQIVNGRVIVDWRKVDPTTAMPWEPYPLRDHNDQVVDEPILHRLQYTIDPDSDRDLGLVWQLIDAQRTINDCLNKLVEWKNRCLNPQLRAQIGSMIAGYRASDEPGKTNWYKPGFQPPEWEKPPNIPQELFQILSTMQEMMRFFASYADATAAPNVAAATVQADVQQSQARWASFLTDLAKYDARLMRHCLLLVTRFYTEPRLLKINGWFGPDRIEDFLGADIRGQVDVRVSVDSLVAMNKQEKQNRLQLVAQTFPGYLQPETFMAALDGDTAQNLIRSYVLDDAKVCRVIERIRDGSVMDMPTRHEMDLQTGMPIMDPMTGQPAEVPGYMPMRDVDNLTVWRSRIGDWMKTPDYERMDPGLQEVPKQILAAINQLELDAQQRQMAAQAAQAEQLGMNAASKPPGFKPVPNQPASPV